MRSGSTRRRRSRRRRARAVRAHTRRAVECPWGVVRASVRERAQVCVYTRVCVRVCVEMSRGLAKVRDTHTGYPSGGVYWCTT